MAPDYRWWRCLWWCSLFATLVAAIPDVNICDVKGCNCTTVHKYWNIVNCSLDNKQVLEVGGGSLAVNTIEVSISGGRELRFTSRAFTNLTNFQRLRVDGIGQLLLQRHAFLDVSGSSVLVQVSQCDTLRFESATFRNMRGPVSLEVSRCAFVSVQKAVFGFLQDATFSEVPRLELAEEAFTLATRDLGHHGAVTTIRFHKVMIPMLPRDVFKSSLAEVSLLESEVREVQGGAFSGNTIAAVLVANSSLHRIRGRAFSERTQLDNLAFTNSRLHHIDTDAVLAAVANLTIQHTNITTFGTGAVNAIVARLIFHHNIVEALYAGALTVRDWSRVIVDNNIFRKMSARALEVSIQDGELSFSGNLIRAADTGALLAIGAVSRARIHHNRFGHTCHCDINRWLEETVGDNCSDSVAADNFCVVDALLAQCYEIEERFLLVKNFTNAYCDDGTVIQCKTFAADANVGGQHSSSWDNDNGGLVIGLVLGLVLSVAICGTIVILLVRGGLWLKKKGYCVRFSTMCYRTEETSTEAEDIMVGPDKPSDQLPEELTQELLQMLRDKLEDPTTYHEAREMIERLYDHFIIEDSYTNNNRHEEETHLYEELGAAAAAAVTTGEPQDKSPSTRPFSFLRLIEERFQLGSTSGGGSGQATGSVLADEYSEPTDAEVHLYSELPAQQHAKEDRQNEINEVLTKARTPSPATSSSGRMAYRPLPPQPAAVGPCPGPSTHVI